MWLLLPKAFMQKRDIRERLELKPVELSHLNQFNELLRYVFQVTDSVIERGGYEDEKEVIRSKRPLLHIANVIGWFDREDLISQVAVYPCEVNIHGTLYKMGGITGVGTYPEYANHGLMHDLIKVALTNMREEGQWISYLFPYSIPYYKRKGWEIMSEKRTFKIRDNQLPKPVEVAGHVERLEIDDQDVIELYDKFANRTHGAMLRNYIYWEEYWRWENEDERTAAVYYDANGQATGLCFYWIADEVFRIKDMIYLNQEARHGLWNFISAHFSMVENVQGNSFKDESIAFLLEDSEIKEILEPYYMARIVDVYQFIKNYPFVRNSKPFHFIVEDPLVDWNNGVFSLSWDNNQDLTISRDERLGEPVYLDIQTLSSMMMSYKRPSYLYEIERLKTDKNTLRHLEEIIPVQSAYFSDYF